MNRRPVLEKRSVLEGSYMTATRCAAMSFKSSSRPLPLMITSCVAKTACTSSSPPSAYTNWCQGRTYVRFRSAISKAFALSSELALQLFRLSAEAVFMPHPFLPQFLPRSEEHTSELQSLRHLVCRLLLEKKKP